LRFVRSAWFGAVAGSAAALLLCVIASRAAYEFGWFQTRQSNVSISVREDVYGSRVRENVYGQQRMEQGSINSPNNRVDKLYSPTFSEDKFNFGSNQAHRN
jgi:hypothetical protein